jgi:hypothetical protein
MPTIKELLRGVFVELLAIAVVTSIWLLLREIGVVKIEPGHIAIVLAVATASGIVVYRLVRRPLRFWETSNSGIGPLYIFTNHLECEDEIIENFKAARRIKVLTARGGRYFMVAGWFYDLLGEKQGRNDQIQILVCSSESSHIDEELAQRLGYGSAEAVRDRMRTSLGHLGSLCRGFPNISVRVYAEKPLWNVLLFDDVMYVAPYVGHASHEKAAVLKFQRNDRSHFVGFEHHFDQLWSHSHPLEEFLTDLSLHV